jgi:hypothetical protein
MLLLKMNLKVRQYLRNRLPNAAFVLRHKSLEAARDKSPENSAEEHAVHSLIVALAQPWLSVFVFR